jgi:Family of unknown function (DUF5677)
MSNDSMGQSVPISEEDFKANVRRSHQEHFDHVFRLHSIAQDAINTFGTQTTTPYEQAVALIFPRAFKAFDSIRRLCEIASCEDAAVVLRSLLNLMAVTRWISLEPSVRARKYLHWYWVQMHNDLQTLGGVIPSGYAPYIEKRYRRVKKQFEYTDGKGKKKQAKKWHQPEASNIYDLFVQTGLKQQYEEGYRPLSGIEHSDATAFFAMIRGAKVGEDEHRLNVQSDIFVPHYLRNAFQYFGDIFEICNRTIPLTDDAELQKVIAEGKAFYEADMKA